MKKALNKEKFLSTLSQILYLLSNYPVQHNVLGLNIANLMQHLLRIVAALVLIGLALRLLHIKLKPRLPV